MDATEITEKGKGATLGELMIAMHGRTGSGLSFESLAPAVKHLHEISWRWVQDVPDEMEAPRYRDMEQRSNVRIVAPGEYLTAADLDRIARAEV